MTNPTAHDRAGTSRLFYLWGFVVAYFAINAATQYFVSGTADLDQSEQLLLSQFLEFGYSAQPPLYTYLTRIVFFVTGPALAPLLLLKVLVMGLMVGALIGIGHQFGFSLRQHLIVLASLAFVPQYVWESQRDLTHSVLTTSLAAATLFLTTRTLRAPSILNYLVLGAAVGLGLISKYNYVIFLCALIVAILVTPRYRAVLLHRRALLALFAAIVVAAPHAYWVLANPELAADSTHKLHAGAGNHLAGIVQAAYSALAFLTPLCIFSGILFWKTRTRPASPKSEDRNFLFNLLMVTIALIAIFVLASGAQQVKDRWYQPLLFYVPLLIAFRARQEETRLNWYLGIGAAFAVLVSLALPLRTTLAESIGHYVRPNLPYPSLIREVKSHAGNPVAVFAESKLLGGNARPYYPDSVIDVPAYGTHPLARPGTALILCDTENCDNPRFRDWLLKNYALDASSMKFTKTEMPYYHAPTRSLSIYWAEIRLTSPAAHS